MYCEGNILYRQSPPCEHDCTQISLFQDNHKHLEEIGLLNHGGIKITITQIYGIASLGFACSSLCSPNPGRVQKLLDECSTQLHYPPSIALGNS